MEDHMLYNSYIAMEKKHSINIDFRKISLNHLKSSMGPFSMAPSYETPGGASLVSGWAERLAQPGGGQGSQEGEVSQFLKWC